MSSIKIKFGTCIDCADDAPHKPLTAGRCAFHYWKYRNKVKADERKAKGLDVDKLAQQKALDLWYANQINQLPKCCENCGEPLNRFAPWAAKAFIAHIVPKRNIISLSTHPLNRLFLCVICHTNYDNWSANKIRNMPVFALAVDRLLTFWQYCHDDERDSLPECFEDIINAA